MPISTPAATLIWMTGPPLEICDRILAPPRSMPSGPWNEVVMLITIDEVTV